jgi:hypothetical protein
LTLALNLGIIEMRSSLGYGMIHTVDMNGNFPIGEILTAGAGFTLGFERGSNERIDLYANSTIQITEGIDFDIRVEHTNYNDFFNTVNRYREFVLRAALLTRW